MAARRDRRRGWGGCGRNCASAIHASCGRRPRVFPPETGLFHSGRMPARRCRPYRPAAGGSRHRGSASWALLAALSRAITGAGDPGRGHQQIMVAFRNARATLSARSAILLAERPFAVGGPKVMRSADGLFGSVVEVVAERGADMALE